MPAREITLQREMARLMEPHAEDFCDLEKGIIRLEVDVKVFRSDPECEKHGH